MRVNTTTPETLTGAVRYFCREVNPDSKPIYVPVRPEPGAEKAECFFNVAEKVSRDGGAAVNGWQIWTWPTVYIEALHHCVWRSPEGRYVDITPTADRERRIAFLPDPERSFDFENLSRLDNIRRALVDDPDVDRFLSLGAELNRLVAEGAEGAGRRTVLEVGSVSNIWFEQSELLERLKWRYARLKDPCPCGSGRKFMRCHGGRR